VVVVWDFPRAQLTVLYLVAIVLMLAVAHEDWTTLVMSAALALYLLY
jgi:hypothetical protein